MIHIEIDWSNYTDYKVDEYERRCKNCPELLTEEKMEEVRQANQPPTHSVCFGINPDSVASFWVIKKTDGNYWYWYTECNCGVACGTCIVGINFTNGQGMKLYCYNDAADRIVEMLYGDRCGFVVKVNGIKEYAICTETKVTSMPEQQK